MILKEKEQGREAGKEVGREGRREGRKEGWKERDREGGIEKERWSEKESCMVTDKRNEGHKKTSME